MHGGWLTDRLSSLSLAGVMLTMLVSTLTAAFIGYKVAGG